MKPFTTASASAHAGTAAAPAAIPAAATAATPQPFPSSIRWPLASLSLGMLLPSLGISIANVGLPRLAQAFDASFQQVQWVLLAYLLATTTLVVSAGRLGDIVGRKRLLLMGIAGFTIASACCGMATSLWQLLAARAAQGLGAAAMMALTMAFVGDTVPKSRTGSAMGLLGTMSAVGTALGPSLGGALMAMLGWQAIFLVKLPLGLLALLLAWRHLPNDRPMADQGKPARHGFDPLGTLLLAATLAAYALAVTLGRGRFGALNVALLAAAALGLVLFAIVEARVESPLIRLAMFREPRLAAGVASSALVSTVVMASLVIGPFHLSHALGLGAAGVGLVLSAGPLVSALAGVPAGRLVDRFGAQRVALIGLAAMGLGCLAMAAAPLAAGIGGYILPVMVITAGYALFQAANNTAVMGNITPDRRGLVSGLLNQSRNLGLITGASVMGALFAFAIGSHDLALAAPEAIAHGLHISFAVAGGLAGLALFIVHWSRRAETHSPASANPR